LDLFDAARGEKAWDAKDIRSDGPGGEAGPGAASRGFVASFRAGIAAGGRFFFSARAGAAAALAAAPDWSLDRFGRVAPRCARA